VEISGVGWFKHCEHVWMPVSANIRYRATNANKRISTGWIDKHIDCSELFHEFCAMKVVLEAGVWEKLEISGVGWFKDGDVVWMPVCATIRYRAIDVAGASTPWQDKHIDCTDLVPKCRVHIVLPEGTWIQISGVGWFQNCAWVDVKPIKPYTYRLWNATKQIASAWKTRTFSASDCGKDWNLVPEFCEMEVNLDGSDGYVEISGVGWFQHGAKIWLPRSATVRYRQWNATKQVATGWEDKHIDCTPLYSPFCYMHISLDESDGYVEISGVGWFKHCDSVWLPVGATIRYRQWNATKQVATDWEDKEVDCTELHSPFCHMEINLDGSDGWVEISGVGWFQHGAKVWLPKCATITYRQWNASRQVATDWETKHVDCSDLYSPFCHMLIDLDESDGYVEIKGVGWFQHGDRVWLPICATITYRQWNATKQVATDWETKHVDCSDLYSPFCHMHINLDESDGYVEISGVGWFKHCDYVWLPMGATITYRQWNATKQVATDWETKNVDCNELHSPFCNMKIVLIEPAGGWVEISGVGWFQDGGQVWLPICATIRYRVWDASKQTATGWLSKHIDCSDLVHPVD
jgi:hypothetical protein